MARALRELSEGSTQLLLFATVDNLPAPWFARPASQCNYTPLSSAGPGGYHLHLINILYFIELPPDY